MMEKVEDFEQFSLLEKKVNSLIELIIALKKEKEDLSGKHRIQEEKIVHLNKELDHLKAVRDEAKEKVVSLLEKIDKMVL